MHKLIKKSNMYEDYVIYEFYFPRKYCGKLIGKNGCHVDYVRNRTSTQIAIRNDATATDLQIVSITGRLEDVDEALDIITREGQLLHHGLLPRERAIVALLERRTRTALDGAGVMRAAAELEVAAANHDEAWAARYISAP